MTNPDTGQIDSVKLRLGVTVFAVPENSPQQIAAVVLQNFSAYLVQVAIGGTTAALGPYTSNRFPVTGAGTPVGLTASNPDNASAALPAYVVYDFLAPEDPLADPDNSSFPSTLNPPAGALAAATATQLLATGVPQVLLEDVLFDSDVTQGSTQFIDITKYLSLFLIVFPSQQNNNSFDTLLNQLLTKAQGGIAGSNIRKDRLQISNSTAVQGPTIFQVSCQGDIATITNADTLTHRYTLFGSNRPATGRIVTVNNAVASEMERWIVPSQLFVSGTAVSMTRQDAPVKGSQGGECDMWATIGNAQMTAAQIIMNDTTTGSALIADNKDTNNAFTDAIGFLRVNRRLYVPPGATFSYIPRAAATFAPTLNLSFRS